jgi:hypothetical protein
VERKRYNETVQELNSYVRSIFGRIFSNMAGVKEGTYFEAPKEATTVPTVNFSMSEWIHSQIGVMVCGEGNTSRQAA